MVQSTTLSFDNKCWACACDIFQLCLLFSLFICYLFMCVYFFLTDYCGKVITSLDSLWLLDLHIHREDQAENSTVESNHLS